MNTSNATLLPPWHGLPREQIMWFPTVIAERCVGCGLCVTGCGSGVYSFDYENKVVIVSKPLGCKVGCTTCRTTCVEDAIQFPDAEYLRDIITANHITDETKVTLYAYRDKYRVPQQAGGTCCESAKPKQGCCGTT
jgi:MinD superfamily P-loop ATPase